MGTTRLMMAFAAGFVALAYLAVWGVPLVNGRIEISATEVSIDRIEAEGFPDASYLKVTNGYLVFAEGDANVSGLDNVSGLEKGDGESESQGKLRNLTVPVISKSQWDRWQAQRRRGEPIDASRLRLAAYFRGEQVARLWPKRKEQAETGKDLDPEPVRMTLAGETEPMKFLLTSPLQSRPQKHSLDLGRMRGLRFEKHHHSLGNLVKGLLVGLGFLAVSIGIFAYHRKHPTRPPRATLNVETLEDLIGPDVDLD